MNFLHCFYGIGVSLSPYLMSLALSKGTWEGGYRAVFWFQLAIAALTALALPLWKKVRHAQNGEEAEETPRVLSFPALMKMPKVRMACLVFIGYCALEYTCGTWGSTFLVNAKGRRGYRGPDGHFLLCRPCPWPFSLRCVGRTPPQQAAGQNRADDPSGGVVSLFLPLPFAFCSVSLFFIGLGNGPHFPEYAPPDTGAFRKRPLPGSHRRRDGHLLHRRAARAGALRPDRPECYRGALSCVPSCTVRPDDHRDSSVGVQKGWTCHRQVTFDYMIIQTFLVQLFQASLQLSHQLLGGTCPAPGTSYPECSCSCPSSYRHRDSAR